ncbi:MAG: polysaccharide deacetylase family protein [Bacteroidaceae bacterium]|nr:polysaccharide deacetylase family protein [Bacteroidaceae bacterium]
MNILTFDIEDWYNCDFISGDFDWDKHEVRIYEGVRRILTELDRRNQKGTFFCLGWLAEKHPTIIKEIADKGHQIGVHSYQHELSHRFTPEQFVEDTMKAKNLIESVIGKKVNIFRAPGFSITKNNTWALKSLADMGFEYDCSMFPAPHDYGGMPSYGEGVPKLIDLGDGRCIKEFPINIQKVAGKNIVFSGGGFFRLFPYWLINHWAKKCNYMMTYFHPRDFDTGQPVVPNLPLARRFKSYVGIKGAFRKFQRLLDNYTFVNVEQADKSINWNSVQVLTLKDLEK